MSIKQNTIKVLVIAFALIGYGESYANARDYVRQAEVEKVKISTEELIKKQVCKTAAGKLDVSCITQ